MKPLALIDRYNPFLDQQSQTTIARLVSEATNYGDFFVRLARYVENNDIGEDLAIVAAEHLSLVRDLRFRLRFSQKLMQFELPALYVVLGQAASGRQKPPADYMSRIGRIINSDSDIWHRHQAIKLMLLIMRVSGTVGEWDRLVTQLLQLVQHPTLRPFEAQALNFVAGGHWMRSDYSSARSISNQAIETARRLDDPVSLAWSLNMRAISYSLGDEHSPLDDYEEARAIFESLGIQSAQATLLNNMSDFFMGRGEFERAIECARQAIDVMRAYELDYVYTPFVNLAFIYAALGRYDEAIVAAQDGINAAEKHDDTDTDAYLAMATALALSGQSERALEYLERGGEIALRSGKKDRLAEYYLAKGIVELENGNTRAALVALRRALQHAEDGGSATSLLRVLLKLAEVEAALYGETGDMKYAADSGTALAQIELIAREQQLPNLLVQVLQIRAEIAVSQGDVSRARELLQEASKICRTTDLKTQERTVREAIERLGQQQQTSKSIFARIRGMLRRTAVPSTMSRKTPYSVLGCIVLLSSVGIEIFSEYLDDRLESDPSLVAGLISAMSNFTRELRRGATGELQSIVHQDIAVLLEHGEHITCALLTDRETYDARRLERSFVEEVERRYSPALVNFDGDVRQFTGVKNVFRSVVIDSLRH
ncbi:MAG: tetratricopeptide repeat protein [Candidatus Thorarchaeota archaeon]